MADEPTGNLDTRSSEEIIGLFQDLNESRGITVIFVTHEPDIAAHTKRIIHIRDGQVKSDEPVLDQQRARSVLAQLAAEAAGDATQAAEVTA
jgi:putative ABC transport system ATP-binding protein